MNPAKSTNAPASGTTSSSAPASQTASASTHPQAPQNASSGWSEEDYLRQQSDEAKAAIVGAFSELKTDLAKGVDPRVWMKTHPWITLASAAAAGFAAVTAVVPSKEEQALRKLAEIDRALDGSHTRPEHANGNTRAPAAGLTGFVGMLLKELVGAVKPILITLLTERMTANGKKPDHDKTAT